MKRLNAKSARLSVPGIIALTLVATGFSLETQAQEKPKTSAEPEDLQEVVVTGSRIARPDLDRLEPTTTIDSKTFDTRGYLDVGQALAETPGFGVSPSSAQNTQAGFGIAQSFVDLYGLGSQRTLTLIEGRRFVSSSTASLNNAAASNSPVGSQGSQVDLNVIPTKLIDHVETIKVGGAPIYGADAVAGTVNIILKKDFQGIDMDAQVGASGKGDAWQYRGRILAGTNFLDDRGNVTVVAEFTKTDGLVGTARPNYAQDLQFLTPATKGPYSAVLTPAGTVTGINTSGIPYVDDGVFLPAYPATGAGAVAVNNAAGEPLAWHPGSSALSPYNVGTLTGNPVFGSGGDGLRLSQVSNLLSPTERINIDSLQNFKINDNVALFGEGWFSETHATNLISQPAYNTALFGTAGTANGDFVVNINNPYLQPGDRTLIQNALTNYAAAVAAGIGYGANGGYVDPNWNPNQFYVGRANEDLQSGRATATQVLARGVLGVKGNFELGTYKYNWEVAGNYGTSSNTQVTPSYVFQNVQNALNATTNAAGQIVCAGTPVNAPTSTQSNACAPLNIFGQGSPSRAAVDYITHLATVQSYNTQRDFTANLNGDVLHLPSGDWKASIGFENRRESAEFSPDNFYLQSLGQAQVSAVSGAYHTNELSLETVLPLIGKEWQWPGLYRLEYQGAVRRVDNSVTGNATTYTNGLIFYPVQDVQFRINKTKSIRAPSITELFLPAATQFSFANDPCDHNFVGQGTAPATRAANCRAAGIDPTTFTSNVVNATATGVTSGNQGLASETANSKSFGVVLRPRWVPKLSLSVDYIDINIASAIETLSLTNVLDACYDSANYPTNPSCASFTRNTVGQITDFHVGYVNAGELHFTGIESELQYTQDLPWALGTLSTRLNWLDTQRLQSQIGSASAQSFAGELADVGNVKRKGGIDLAYGYQDFSWDWYAQYIGRANFNNQNTATSQDVFGVGAWWLFNTTVSYNVNRHVAARFIVNNVFDKQPPYPALAGTGGNFVNSATLYFSGILGRSMVAAVDVKF